VQALFWKKILSIPLKPLLVCLPLVYFATDVEALPGALRRYAYSAEGSALGRGTGEPSMSSTSPGRALTFPLAWDRTRGREATAPQLPEERPLSDEELMARVQSTKDAAALECLFDRYCRLVLRIARGIVRDHGEAEDVVQEAFFYLYQKSALFDGSKGTVKNWILQIALHRALDRKSHLARRGFYAGTNLGSLGDTLMGETDLDREIGARLNRAQLQKAFEQLPPIQRLTLELFYFEGLELREISAKLQESHGNTRHHFYRGLERLRKSTFVQQLRERKRC
jgi:RNA polymerase sigma-70 factor, ECF subfamily